MMRFTMPRGRTAGEDVGDGGVPPGVARERRAMKGASGCFGAQQVGGPDLDGRGPQRQGGGDAGGISDPAGRDHRNVHSA